MDPLKLGILVTFFGAASIVNASADCVTTKQLAAGPPYAEFELTNQCRGSAVVHWTRTDEKAEKRMVFIGELGSFLAARLLTNNIFLGPMNLGISNFLVAEKVSGVGDSAKRNDVKNAPQRGIPQDNRKASNPISSRSSAADSSTQIRRPTERPDTDTCMRACIDDGGNSLLEETYPVGSGPSKELPPCVPGSPT
jgi:hypothetical protein